MNDTASQKSKVLVIDDNPGNLDVLFTYLDQAGIEIFVAEDGMDALEQVKYVEPDLILLDILMPGIDGFETCRRLKSQGVDADVPIIFMTALTETTDKIKGFEIGAVDYITKPFQHEEVMARVTTHLSIRRLQRCLRTQNAELKAFGRTVAHDVRSPLTTIIGSVEMMKLETQVSKGQLDYMRSILRSAKQIERTTAALLLLARVRDAHVELEPLDMAAVVANGLDDLAYMIERYRAKIIYPTAWPQSLGYGPWVGEVWLNYLSNALKYGGEQPRIELGSETQPDGYVRFWVRDQGIGLTADEQAGLFVEFNRLNKTQVEGQGLGLSIVRRIVKRLGGQVGVESAAGQGSTFYFTLKASQYDLAG